MGAETEDRPRRDSVEAVSGELLELPSLLAGAPSGIAFIYSCLERLSARYDLSDALALVDTETAGRQAFRLGRTRLRPSPSQRNNDWLPPLATAPPGLYTAPATVGSEIGDFVAHLVEIALRVDLLRHDASHDPLTGLLNRRSYEAALTDAIARSKRYTLPFALLLIDLDNFKAVNDRWGHVAGDAALRALGNDLRSSLRGGDVAARLGGDEFALIILNAENPSVADTLLARLQVALDRAVPEAQMRFSAGVALFPEEAGDEAELTELADRRLYANKTAGA